MAIMLREVPMSVGELIQRAGKRQSAIRLHLEREGVTVSKSTLSRWITGRSPITARNLAILLDVLDASDAERLAVFDVAARSPAARPAP